VANKTKRSAKRVKIILDALRDGSRVEDAAAAAGVGRTTLHDWRRDDEDLEKEVQAAMKEGCEALEDEALRRAVHGTKKPVGFHLGEHGGTFVDEYSDTLLMFILKARNPEKYRENVKLEHTGPGGAALVPVINLTVGPETPS